MKSTLTQRLDKTREEVLSGVRDFVSKIRGILSEELTAAYLFGSFARGEEKAESEIDILLLVTQYNYKFRKQLSALSSDYSLTKDVLISPILKDEAVWNKNRYYNTLFYQEIQRDGIRLC